MNEILILSSARKAVLARLSTLGRHFCEDDVNEMVSMAIERFYTRGAYDPSRAAVQTYVSRIASNVVYDYVVAADKNRSRFCSLEAVSESDPTETDTFILEREQESRLERAKERLSPKFREYFDLIIEGNSLKEIARRKGTTASNAGVVAHRMRKQLRALVNA